MAEDNLGDQTLGPDGEPVNDPAGKRDNRPYLGTWLTPEDAEKGVKELHGAKTRAEQEAAELRGRLSAYEELRKSQDDGPKGESTEDRKARREAFVQRVNESDNPGEVYLEALDSVYDEIKSEIAQATGREKKELQSELAALKKQMAVSSPEYQKYAERVDALKADPTFADLSDEKLVAIAKREARAAGEGIESETPPNRMRGGGGGGSDDVVVNDAEVSKLMSLTGKSEKQVREYLGKQKGAK